MKKEITDIKDGFVFTDIQGEKMTGHWIWWNRLTEEEQDILLQVLMKLDLEDCGIGTDKERYYKRED